MTRFTSDIVVLAVRINGIDSGLMTQVLRQPSGNLLVTEEAARAWRLKLDQVSWMRFDDENYVSLADIPDLTYQVDAPSQTLVLEINPSAFAKTTSDAASSGASGPVMTSSGGFANYTVQGQDGGGTGLLELGAFDARGVGTASGLYNGVGQGARWIRLDTTWTVDRPAQLQSFRLGDGISGGGDWGRSIRFGGVQWATNFATQPNLITMPLPTLHGEAAVPSTYDVYVNNVRQAQGGVPAGPFVIPNVPVVTGQGEVQLSVRDLLGRQQVITLPYYASPRLLSPGLESFSVEAGKERLFYGVESSEYGRAFASATDRVGLTHNLTAEFRAEATEGQQAAGIGAAWNVLDLGVGSASLALSRGDQENGALVGTGFERQTLRSSFSAQVQYASRNFRQLGQIPGITPRMSLHVGAGRSLFGQSFGVSYLRQTTWEQPTATRLLTANAGISAGALGTLGLFVTRDLGGPQGTVIGLTLIHRLEGQNNASGNVTHDNTGTEIGAQLQHDLPPGEGIGYRLDTERGVYARDQASGTWRTSVADLSADVGRFQGDSHYRIAASGALAFVDNCVFPSRTLDDSFAVVKVGEIGGVRVLRDNQEVARTGPDGRAMVTGLHAYQTNLIGIEQADLPWDTDIQSLQRSVMPAFRSGAIVNFAAAPRRAMELRLLDEQGQPVPPGAVVRISGQEGAFLVGFDGRTYVSGLAARNRVTAAWADRRCTFDLTFAEEIDATTQVCRDDPR